jgi:uncharacterized protein (AIM24 family)
LNFVVTPGETESGFLTLQPQEFVYVNPAHILSHDPTLDLEKGAPNWMPQPMQKLIAKSGSEPILKAAYGKGQAILTTGFPGKLTLHRLPGNFRVRSSAIVARDSTISRKASQSFSLNQQLVELDGDGDLLLATRGSLILIELDFDQIQHVSALNFVGLAGQATIKLSRYPARIDAKSGQWLQTFHVVTGPGTIWMQTQSEPLLPYQLRKVGKK